LSEQALNVSKILGAIDWICASRGGVRTRLNSGLAAHSSVGSEAGTGPRVKVSTGVRADLPRRFGFQSGKKTVIHELCQMALDIHFL
jgi:hypothetical protein